jgi:type III secretion protein D
MEHDTHFDDGPGALELRVLSGPQAGARAPLPAGRVRLLAAGAHADDADILLREERENPVRARIVAAGGAALVEVIDGPAMLAGQLLAAGESTDWPMHAPLQVGSSVVAYGLAADDAWPDVADAPVDAAEAGGTDAAPPPARRQPKKSRSGTWLIASVMAVAVAGTAALGVVRSGMPSLQAAAAPTSSLADALRTSEFAAVLSPAQDASGRLELRGRLATLAQRTKLDAWLAARQLTPLVNVVVDEALARDVTEVFRVNGVPVQARAQGPGHIVVEAAERDAEHLARAEEVVRRDVRGLAQLGVVNRVQPVAPPRAPVPDDPGKRIASLVPGSPAYLVTADGSRYFVGAMLPSGHRITAIGAQRVQLERDGQSITLNL